ncbi:MAG: hypothetical protein BMS9Abin37_1096 [Acidobacteriota bacterium]|nr:MAG: hypothetical protein BMS9Abin37_1096 [Acidobacteriota bacterium]
MEITHETLVQFATNSIKIPNRIKMLTWKGGSSKPVVVMVHGYGATERSWQPLQRDQVLWLREL